MQRASSTAQPGGKQLPGSSAPEQADKGGAQSHTDQQTRRRKGSVPDQADSQGLDMPAIPGAEVPRGWHDKRTDVKTGYFSKQERQAIRDGAEVRMLPGLSIHVPVSSPVLILRMRYAWWSTRWWSRQSAATSGVCGKIKSNPEGSLN